MDNPKVNSEAKAGFHGDVFKVNKSEKRKCRHPCPTPTHSQGTASAEMFPKKCLTKLSGRPSVLSKS